MIVVGRDRGRLASALAEGFDTVTADLSDAAGCDALVAELGRPADRHSGQQCRHGRDLPGAACPSTWAEIDRCIFLNLNAPIRLIAGLLDGLRARPRR